MPTLASFPVAARIAAGLVVLLHGLPVIAQDAPRLKHGMWEFNRTIEGQQTLTTRKCTDPGADMKAMRERLAAGGCKLSRSPPTGTTSSSTTTCPVSGATVVSETRLTVESESAYAVHIETSGGGKSSTENLRARRVGDC